MADKYLHPDKAVKSELNISLIARLVPMVVSKLDTSKIKKNQDKPDWSLYRIVVRGEVPYIVRELCDRCGKVFIPPARRKLRVYKDKAFGEIYLETGICNDCINASVYVDKYLDGEVLTEKEAKEQFYEYAAEYEKAWRMVLAAAPRIALTEQEWEKRCTFFGGCAFCAGQIEVRAKYFPIYLNGAHTAWNVVPLCNECLKKHYYGRTASDRKVHRYKVFSGAGHFNRTKTVRMYLLGEMETHKIYMEPLQPYRKRFFETRRLQDD